MGITRNIGPFIRRFWWIYSPCTYLVREDGRDVQLVGVDGDVAEVGSKYDAPKPYVRDVSHGHPVWHGDHDSISTEATVNPLVIAGRW